MKIPLLKSGDSVAIVATARKVSPSEIAPSVELLESWGLHVVLPDGLFASDCQFAGSDSHRAAVLQRVLDDESVKAIFCARGGYGTVRIIDKIDFSHFSKYPKWIVGYSDVTVLHSHVARHCEIPTLHATMPIDITSDSRSSKAVESLHDFLFKGSLNYNFSTDNNRLGVANRVGSCKGSIVGGNLSILYSLLSSPSDVFTDGEILMIEDLDEYLYHIDRMIVALRRAGKLEHIKGLIVGSFSDMHDNNIPFGRSAEAIIRDAVSEYDFPVAFGCPFGHLGSENITLPFGLDVRMEVGENKVSISCLETL